MLSRNEQLLLDLKKNVIDNILCSLKFKRLTQRLGLHVTRAKYYSSTPTINDLENHYRINGDVELYNHPSVFDPPTLINMLSAFRETSLEFNPPAQPSKEGGGYYSDNPMFSHSDAMAYYCMIKYSNPKQIIEIGSGFSTSVAHYAVKSNNQRSRIICYEPYPTEFLRSLNGISIRIQKAQDISARYLNDLLCDGDILFIDSTHTVKEGSDVIHILCSILPNIEKNIYVHFHDIFLPYSMPKSWVLGNNWFWEEQYLVYAFLMNNPRAKVLFSSSYNAINFPSDMKGFTVSQSVGGGSLWFEYN